MTKLAKNIWIHSLKEITILENHHLSGEKNKIIFPNLFTWIDTKMNVYQLIHHMEINHTQQFCLTSWTFLMPTPVFRFQASTCIK